MNSPGVLWSYLRSSFWFIPSLIVLGSIILAVVLIEVGSIENNKWLAGWPRLFGAGPEGARQMLSTLAGSMMSVMGITFSITLIALALAANQYTSRSLRNFMSSRVTQITLGIFAGIFAYCLIVLRVIRSGEMEFVPNLAVFFGFVMALGAIGVLIFFIHHIASSIQASSIISSIAQETIEFINCFFPEKLKNESDENENQKQFTQSLHKENWHLILAEKNGYVQSVQNDMLLRVAREKDSIVKMERGIGEFIVQNTVLASIYLKKPPDHELIESLHKAYCIGRYRTVDQDPVFGIRQIVDIALKALSPGVNDAATAVICVDYLTVILSQFATREFPLSYLYDGDKLRVIRIVPTFEGILATAFNQIRNSAAGNVAIMIRILSALDTIAGLTTSSRRRLELQLYVKDIAELAEHSIESTKDHSRIKAKLLRVRKSFDSSS